MPAIVPCGTCGLPLDCTTTDPLDLYRLEGPVAAANLICPEGSDCMQSKFIRMLCCEQELSATLQKGLSQAQRTVIINTLVQNCRVREESCGGVPNTLYFNSNQLGSATCGFLSGGQTYNFITPAGSYLAPTLALANQYALEYAESFVKDNMLCSAGFTFPASVVGDAINIEASFYGGTPPFAIELFSGSLPTGLSLSILGRKAYITGTIVAPGLTEAIIHVNDSLGGYWEQTLTVLIT